MYLLTKLNFASINHMVEKAILYYFGQAGRKSSLSGRVSIFKPCYILIDSQKNNLK